MGVEYYTARFLLQARRDGAQFGRVLTIGRQNFVVTGPQLQSLAREFQIEAPTLDAFLRDDPAALVYVEPFLKRLLGATEVESLDRSTYEGATHAADMNFPLPTHFHNRFDTIVEAGSLEHIFNFPIAIQNLMRALKPGGNLFIQTPANNYFGHGFYQFSPELFYRVLSAENGFAVRRMQALEHFFPCHFFATAPHHVSDPATVRKRVQLVNNRPTLLLVHAQKIADQPIFSSPPQQSDYVPLWENATAPSAATPTAPIPTCHQSTWRQKIYALPLKLWGSLFLQYLLNRKNAPALKNREFFKREP